MSIANLNSAWQRVSENRGCCGSDGITIERFGLSLEQNLNSMSNSIRSGRYHPYPLLRFSIPKRKSKGFRFLSVPTVRDRVAQAAAFLATKEIFEAEFEDVSHAYRKGRGVITAVAEIKKWRDKGYRYVVDADIEAYFDNVPHDLLLHKLGNLLPDPPVLRLFEKWIKVEVYDGVRIWTLDKGIPQGSVVSPVLANLFLDELDETLMSLNKKLVRYADDFVILSKTEAEAQENIELTDMILEDMKLDLNPVKTKIESFDKGFKFLGAIFLYNDVYLPFPEKRPKKQPLKLPPPLSLMRYLELRNK
ncbi:MAG: reverse transcriptase domain-containing protein [bacterium]|nr:reverse transcriptase domain-containing protein [bacterium]